MECANSCNLLASWCSFSLLSFANLLACLLISMFACALILYSEMLSCVCCYSSFTISSSMILSRWLLWV